ncbi:hypothetical protein FA15DRAFT_669558 [Coprinopsis marcescibilis]|uniref:DUF2470 domain-containing protein n=1 Tax=Coprinopsis marcescibilis TaxID=230819 RepID=A0A5C3KW44_COPMA|nr:hypothetical protein FA15DRAFT_669558 [Coprinopsis marcescibilis]
MPTSDPVADKSQFLCMYMSGHPDTLVAYAKWYGKVEGDILTAKMTAIDSKSITLKCTPKARPQDKDSLLVVVPIEPALSGYEAVKPRLLEMKALAQEGLGMLKAPKVTEFRLPFDYHPTFTTITAALVAVTFGAHFIGSWADPTSTADSPALAWALAPLWGLRSLLGGPALRFNFWAVGTVHLLESLYTGWLCYNHSTGPVLGAQYVFSTLFLGFPVWSSLRKRIQQARIDSVMKVQ